MSGSLFYHISRAGELARFATADAALAAAKDGGSVWLYYCQATKGELSKLIDPLGLHPLSIEDCFDKNEIPNCCDSSLPGLGKDQDRIPLVIQTLPLGGITPGSRASTTS